MTNKQKQMLREKRLNAIANRLRYLKHDLAERLKASKKIFGRKVLAVDIHSHSRHSDGTGTVAENCEAAVNAGLDFFFATDHTSLKQKQFLRNIPHTSWGQEPGAGGHHIGLLQGRRLFKPGMKDIAADLARAQKIADFAWIPHPVGWYPGTWYDDERVMELRTLGNAFAMEVINGANKPVRAYDQFDCKAVRIWDELLSSGRRVTALGGSDAHCPDDIGSVWTGTFAPKRTAGAIIQALKRGECFASEASLLELSCRGKPMGSVISVRAGTRPGFSFRVADSGGIASVRLVMNGRVVKEIAGNNRPLVKGTWSAEPIRKSTYCRLESTAFDDRRAFSTPVYLEAGKR